MKLLYSRRQKVWLTKCAWEIDIKIRSEQDFEAFVKFPKVDQSLEVLSILGQKMLTKPFTGDSRNSWSFVQKFDFFDEILEFLQSPAKDWEIDIKIRSEQDFEDFVKFRKMDQSLEVLSILS